MPEGSPNISRRAVLVSSAVTLSGFAGCSTTLSDDDSPTPSDTEAPLDRILVGSNTGEVEPVRLTLVYGPPDGHTERPVWKTVDAPADEDPIPVGLSLDTGEGVYSLTAVSQNHNNHEVISINSARRLNDAKFQFEVGIQQTGDLWINQAEAGDRFRIP